MMTAALSVPAGAQTLLDRGIQLWNRLLQPNPRLDTAWIFQPVKSLGFSTTYEVVRTAVVTTTSEDFTSEDTRILFDIRLGLKDRAAQNLGFKVRYGPLSLGFSHEIGRKVGKNKVYGLNYITPGYGIEARYARFSAPLHGSLDITIKDFPDPEMVNVSESIPIESDHPGQMQTIVLDGFYAFNRERFSYVSVYNGLIVQKKSAGSVMAAAKYMHGDMRIDAAEFALMAFMVGLGRFSTNQFSLGGGYSYNWVPMHRDAIGRDDLTGLRNVTFNVTAIPLLTVFNRVTTREYVVDENYDYTDRITKKHVSNGRLIPNFMARAGVSYATGHFYTSLWSDYSFILYSSGKARSFDEDYNGSMAVSQKGRFSTWRVMLQLNYRF